jgi:hypothetical protein
MIEFSSTIISLLQNPSVDAFYMVRIYAYYTTSHFNNITLSNGETYVADGRIVQVDPPKLSATVDRELYKVTLADPDYTLGAAAQSGLVGKEFEVRIGFINPSTNAPYTQLANTILAYKGLVDSIAYNIGTGNVNEAILSVTGSSPMSDLDLTRSFYTSKEYIRTLNTNDTCFDQIYEGSGPVQLKWGRG